MSSSVLKILVTTGGSIEWLESRDYQLQFVVNYHTFVQNKLTLNAARRSSSQVFILLRSCYFSIANFKILHFILVPGKTRLQFKLCLCVSHSNS